MLLRFPSKLARPLTLLGALGLFALTLGQPVSAARRAPAAAASAVPSAAPTTSAIPLPTPVPTPTSPAFSTLDGYWEVVVQTPSDNIYSRFSLRQSADTLSGTWTQNGKQLPFEGTYDGHSFKLTVKQDPHDLLLTGYVEAASDMVGIIDDGSGKDPTAFTASHRATYQAFPKHDKKK